MFGCLNKFIEKPLRYVGGELNSIVKKSPPAKMLLAFPDVYEIGMSHFGSRILYEIVNYNSEYALERVYMPWKDLYAEMKKNGTPLVSLESQRKFSDFDVVGFSLQHELSCTNVLAMLELGGVELISEKRGETSPIIIAGGGSVYNPAPMAMFIDAFVIGEADESILEIFDVLKKTKSRKERLQLLSKIKGIYVPLIHGKDHVIEKRVISSLDDTPILSKPFVPYMELVHDRITYEVQRGCNRGCRFCQAGVVYRPVRQRSPEKIIEALEHDIDHTGYRDIGFLSLNACDYAPLLKVVDWIYKRFKNRGMYVSLPSLRIESISDDFLGVLSKLPKSGFTIAPEAGTDKLRKAINKDVTEEETLRTIELVSKLGWENIKSYFMIGLPKEDDSDITAIADFAHKMQGKLYGGRNKLTISVSNFVPKPQTPFQWEKQLSWEEFDSRLSVLSRSLRDRRLSLKWGDPKMSEVEGVLARGDEKIGELILTVYKKGEIFTGWGGEFHYSTWINAMNELGINKSYYLGEKSSNVKLPWNNISSGVTDAWLKEERNKAHAFEKTDNCLTGDCSKCGVCTGLKVKNILKTEIKIDEVNLNISNQDAFQRSADKKVRLRGVFGKTGKFKWMGHFELMNAIEKAVLRAKLPVSISQGFKPTLLLSYSPPVGTGIESFVELLDVCLSENIGEKEFMEKINQQLPEELKIRRMWKIDMSEDSLNQSIQFVDWIAEVEGKQKQIQNIEGKIIQVERKGKTKQLELSKFVCDLKSSQKGNNITLNFKTCFVEGKTVKPMEVLRALLPEVEEQKVFLTRKGVSINGVYINY